MYKSNSKSNTNKSGSSKLAKPAAKKSDVSKDKAAARQEAAK